MLECNRQSVYNYIKRLEENGCSFTKFTHKNHIYYSFNQVNSTTDELLYEPITFDVLRKYTIVQQLQQGAIPKNELKDKFAFYSSTHYQKETSKDSLSSEESSILKTSTLETCATKEKSPITTLGTEELTTKKHTSEKPLIERDCTPLDVGITQYYHLLQDLIQAGDIVLNSSTKKYFLTGKNIPLQMVLDEDTLYKLHISLETMTRGTPYYNQFQSIYTKTSLLLGDITDTIPYFENYIVYGKKMNGLSTVAEQLKKISAYSYQNKVLEIRYHTKKQEEYSILFATGMLLYSVEKDILYLVGENYSQKQENATYPYSIIDASNILEIKETMFEHSCYCSDYYMQLFHSMFSISVETPVDVKVEFDRILNIERKIRYLAKQRKYATYKIIDNKIIYTDKISGLNDFAMYLRKLGRNAHVIEPPVLKDKMKYSIAQTLHRYEEEKQCL